MAAKAFILAAIIILDVGLLSCNADCGGDPTMEEIEVLLSIYQSTNGKEWRRKEGWDCITTQDNCSYFGWYGITFDEFCMVTKIVLPDNNLNGTLPRTLWKLRQLETLDLKLNKNLRGRLDDFISWNMTQLKKLDLSFCSFNGTIPEEITLLTNLEELRLCSQRSVDKLTGMIPKGIANLTKLRVLGLGENRFNSPLPLGIGALRKLEVLDLENVNISSTFYIFTNLKRLQSLNLSKTCLFGELPSDLGNLFPHMREFLLPGNLLDGSLPYSIGMMKNLTRLSLANNKLSGAIPSNITKNTPFLKFIDLSENCFSSISESNFSLVSDNLEILVLSNNEHLSVDFTHFFGRVISQSAKLNVLIIKKCNFSGEIPRSIWSFGNLIYVDVGRNKLRGHLPEVLTPMYTLLHLDVSHNLHLKGPIPTTLLRIESLHSLDIRNTNMAECSRNEEDNDCIYATLSEQGIEINDHSMHKLAGTYSSCPTNAFLRVTKGKVFLDPTYYRYVFCKCDKNYYGKGRRCRKCMKPGGKCDNNHNMTILKGYWPEPNPENVTHLTLCNNHSNFLSDKRSSSCNPTGNCTCVLGNLNTTICEKACLCMEGSHDRLCSRCDITWYKSGNICRRCPSHHHATYIFISILLATLVIFVVSLLCLKNRPRLSLLVIYGQMTILLFLRCFNVIPGWVFEVNAIILLFYLAGMGNSTKGLLKIAVFYFQILDAMVSTYQLWPKVILQGQQYISSLINFKFPGLMCDIPDLYSPIGQFITLILLPVACLFITWFFYSLVWMANRIEVQRWNLLSIKYYCLQITVTCLNLTYFPIVLRSIAVLASCQDRAYMRIAPWIRCDSPTSSLLKGLAWVSTFVYVIGVPLFVFLPLLLCYVRSHKRSTLTKHEKEGMDKWLGSIYLPYKEKYRSFFEVYALLRKLLLAFMIGYIPGVSSLQTFFVSLVLVGALIFHLVWQPYQSSLGWIPTENILETIILVVLQHSFILLRFTTVEKVLEKRLHLLWIIVSVNCMVVFFLIVIISVLLANRAAKSIKSRPKNESSEAKKVKNDVISRYKSNMGLFKPLLMGEDNDTEDNADSPSKTCTELLGSA